MKNREKFAKEILDIVCSGRSIAVTKENKIARCNNISCESCMFDSCGKHIGRSQACSDQLREWAESEYVEKPTITSREKAFLGLILSKWKYLARSEDKSLCVFDSLPIKREDGWYIENISMYDYCYIYTFKKVFGDMFNFIKWEDEKPWSIEDLKNLEVKDDGKANG